MFELFWTQLKLRNPVVSGQLPLHTSRVAVCHPAIAADAASRCSRFPGRLGSQGPAQCVGAQLEAVWRFSKAINQSWTFDDICHHVPQLGRVPTISRPGMFLSELCIHMWPFVAGGRPSFPRPSVAFLPGSAFVPYVLPWSSASHVPCSSWCWWSCFAAGRCVECL